jgi:hypothetical protein
MARIFISYRRADSAGFAGRLYDYLSAAFGDRRVFMDIDDIPPGEDFVRVIRDAVAQCEAVIVLIGPQWVSITGSNGRRLDDPYDFVRLEVATALARPGVRVIPVLVNDASMPRAKELPDDLKPLVRRNGMEVSNQRFRYDVDRLIRALGGKPESGGLVAVRGAADESPAKQAYHRGRWMRMLILFAVWTVGTTLLMNLGEVDLLGVGLPLIGVNFFLLPLIIAVMVLIWPLRTRSVAFVTFVAVFLNGYFTDWYYYTVLDEGQAGMGFILGMAAGAALVAMVVSAVRNVLGRSSE